MSRARVAPARPGARAWAAGFDAVLALAVALPLLWLTGGSGGDRSALQVLSALALTLALLSLMAVPLWFLLGATPGQLFFAVRVVSAEDGELPSLPQALRRWLGIVATGASLGLVRRRAGAGWADRWAGTQTVRVSSDRVDRDPDDPWPDTPYAIAHWLGELPLACSLWVDALLLPLVVAMVIHAVAAWLQVHGDWLRVGGVLLAVLWLVLLAVAAWGAVGAWRSADAHRDHRDARLHAIVARLLVVTVLPAVLVGATMNFAPRLIELPLHLVGRDPAGQLELRLSADGRRLRLQGPIGLGDGSRVRKAMREAPRLQLVELASPGGRMREAERVAAVVRARALQVRAVAPCDNACAIVFMAGKSRQLAPQARLGFQRQSAGPFNPLFQRAVNRDLGTFYRRAGLPATFVTKALATPPAALWSPDGDELAAGVVTLAAQPLDVELPSFEAAQASDYAEALNTHAAWQALERRFPGAVQLAATRMHEARAGGGDEDAVMVAGQVVIDALLPELLSNAGPELRQHYLALLTDQLAAAQALGPEACRDLLAGDTAVRRKLPATLARRELAWLIDAAAEPPRKGPPRRLNALESEVLRRTLGERAPALLAAFWRAPQAEAREFVECRAAQALLGEIARLAAPERRLALRVMFERP